MISRIQSINFKRLYSLIFQQYVQDLLKANSEDVCEMILLNGGHIYVCGDVSMANDVAKTMLNLLQEFAALSQVEAQECMSQLRVSSKCAKFRVPSHEQTQTGLSFRSV